MALHKACAQLLDIRQKQSGFFWTTIGHGGGGKIRGAILKSMGVKPGVADILICKKDFIGWIEVKSETGVLSPEQREFRTKMLEFGHAFAVVNSLEGMQTLLTYWKV